MPLDDEEDAASLGLSASSAPSAGAEAEAIAAPSAPSLHFIRHAQRHVTRGDVPVHKLVEARDAGKLLEAPQNACWAQTGVVTQQKKWRVKEPTSLTRHLTAFRGL